MTPIGGTVCMFSNARQGCIAALDVLTNPNTALGQGTYFHRLRHANLKNTDVRYGIGNSDSCT